MNALLLGARTVEFDILFPPLSGIAYGSKPKFTETCIHYECAGNCVKGTRHEIYRYRLLYNINRSYDDALYVDHYFLFVLVYYYYNLNVINFLWIIFNVHILQSFYSIAINPKISFLISNSRFITIKYM